MSDPTFDPFAPFWRRPERAAVLRHYLAWGCRAEDEADDPTGAADAVVAMTFFATADEQWDVIRELVRDAPECAFPGLAAGPVEGFLGRFDASVIDRVEAEAERDPKFRRVLRGVWQHQMSQAVWARVQALQAPVSED